MTKKCLHCDEEVKNNQDDFCCLGCSAAYKIVGKFGFENYYKLRQIDINERKIKPEIGEKIDISQFIVKKDDYFEVDLMVHGLHCAACVWLIESILKKQENIILARINLSKKTLLLRWKNDFEAGNKAVDLISDIGYKLLPFNQEILDEEEKKYDNSILKALAVAGFGVGNIMLFSFSLWFIDAKTMGIETRNLLHLFSAIIALPVIIYSVRPFFSSALKSIKAGYPNMDLAISIAITLACLVSILETFRKANHVYFDSAVMLIFFLLIGRYLDLKARKKAFAIATEFSLLNASFGRVEDGLKIKILPIKDLQKDMILVIAAGEKIAADGIVIEGESEVDMAIINGEILPKKITLQSQVFAGTINLSSPIKVRISNSSKDSLLSQIILLTSNIENKKNHYIRIADRLAKFYLPLVHILAFLTFLFWFKKGWEAALMNATAVLIITCPCALALAVPIVQTLVISYFTKKGILVKSGEALEKISEISTIVFDKTGSITVGKPRLKEVFEVCLDEHQEIPQKNNKNHYLKIAASIAKKSKHPLSIALCESYLGDLYELEVKEYQGLGLEAVFENEIVRLGKDKFCGVEDVGYELVDKVTNPFQCSRELESIDISRTPSWKGFVTPSIGSCKTTSSTTQQTFLKIKNKIIIFIFEDEIKSDAKQVISKLKLLNKHIILLSGDIEKNVKSIAEKLEITEFYFEKDPTKKLEILEKLKAENKKFIMIGDGLNDAPSLALADVSISFLNAIDLSKNIADIIIQNQKLSPIIDLITLSKKSILLMKQNLIIALIYNAIALPFAVSGNVVPLTAAIAMSSSSLLVLFNSLRITPRAEGR